MERGIRPARSMAWLRILGAGFAAAPHAPERPQKERFTEKSHRPFARAAFRLVLPWVFIRPAFHILRTEDFLVEAFRRL